MMAEPAVSIRGFAILPRAEAWGDLAKRYAMFTRAYRSFHIPICGIMPGGKLVVDFSVLADNQRWHAADILSQEFYPNATAPQVYAHGMSNEVLISLKGITLYTDRPIEKEEWEAIL